MTVKGKALAGIQALVGVTAVVGGVALVVAPDGRLLAADTSVLNHSPFVDFLIPGILLAVFVGGGGLLAAVLTWRGSSRSRPIGIAYAIGLLAFELVELLIISWQPLQAFEATLGLAMLALILDARAGVGRHGRLASTSTPSPHGANPGRSNAPKGGAV